MIATPTRTRLREGKIALAVRIIVTMLLVLIQLGWVINGDEAGVELWYWSLIVLLNWAWLQLLITPLIWIPKLIQHWTRRK